jgi:hypothetical protein
MINQKNGDKETTLMENGKIHLELHAEPAKLDQLKA